MSSSLSWSRWMWYPCTWCTHSSSVESHTHKLTSHSITSISILYDFLPLWGSSSMTLLTIKVTIKLLTKLNVSTHSLSCSIVSPITIIEENHIYYYWCICFSSISINFIVVTLCTLFNLFCTLFKLFCTLFKLSCYSSNALILTN